MPPRTRDLTKKVERSEHYGEIVEKLNEGWSCRKISKYLEETYDEHITFNTICSYRKYLNDKIEEQVEEIRRERAEADIRGEESIDGKARILLICEQLFNEIPGYVEKINWEEMTNRDIVELMKVLKDIAKMRLDFAKTQEVDVNINDTGLNKLFDDDLIKSLIEETNDEPC